MNAMRVAVMTAATAKTMTRARVRAAPSKPRTAGCASMPMRMNSAPLSMNVTRLQNAMNWRLAGALL